jgi:hypothetical protein
VQQKLHKPQMEATAPTQYSLQSLQQVVVLVEHMKHAVSQVGQVVVQVKEN